MRVEAKVPVRGVLRPAVLHRPSTPPRGLIVFVHGSGEGTVEFFSWYAGQLNDLGVACLVVDKVMDGYTGLRRDYDALADDAGEALKWAHGRPEFARIPMGLLGYSEGSWVATLAAARYPELVDLVVLCSAPLTRPRDQTAYHRAHAHTGSPAPLRGLRYAAMWTAMALLSDYGNCDTTEELAAIPAPVVLVLGAEDPTLDVDRACRTFERIRHGVPAPILVPGADHALPADSEWVARVAEMLLGTAEPAHRG